MLQFKFPELYPTFGSYMKAYARNVVYALPAIGQLLGAGLLMTAAAHQLGKPNPKSHDTNV